MGGRRWTSVLASKFYRFFWPNRTKADLKTPFFLIHISSNSPKLTKTETISAFCSVLCPQCDRPFVTALPRIFRKLSFNARWWAVFLCCPALAIFPFPRVSQFPFSGIPSCSKSNNTSGFSSSLSLSICTIERARKVGSFLILWFPILLGSFFQVFILEEEGPFLSKVVSSLPPPPQL